MTAVDRDKFTKQEVRYQSRPNDGERCSDCRHFLPPRACEGVSGVISKDGWCRRFSRKRKAA